MSNTNRDYVIIYDVKNGSLVLSRPLVFYLTDKNTSNIFVRLVTRINMGDGIDQYADIENASNYVLTMRVIKPNNGSRSIEAIQHEPESIFQFDLNEDFKDIPGKYICELTISTIVNSRQELITSNPFNYEVKRSILSKISDTIEIEDITVEKILNDLEATKTDVSSRIKRFENKKISLNDCDGEMLAAIQNKEGETPFNILSIPQDKSVDYAKFKTNDLYSAKADWSTLTNKTDEAGNWCNSYLYKRGFVKNIIIGVNSDTDMNGKAFIYKRFADGAIRVQDSYEFTGHGEIVIPINKYIEYNFYVSTRCPNVRYGSSTYMTSAALGSNTGYFTPNFEFNYVFAVGVEFDNLYDSTDKLTFDMSKNLLRPCSLIPNNGATDYPIVFNFIDKQMTISNMYILDTSESKLNKPTYYLQNQTLTIKDIPNDGYYVIYLLFDVRSKVLSLAYSNGASLPLGLETFTNKVVLCYGLTDGKTYFTFGDINKDYVKVIVKQNLNTDITNDDDKIIPKYAEKKIITALQQKNRWFNKKANIIGDSIIKGENSANSYKRMKDDNVASILMEEFGFKEVRNYGIGGSKITIHDGNRNGMISRYTDMNNDSDLNIVSGGTNDFGNNVQLGDLSDLSDNTKFKPALYNLLTGMQNKYPGKELYFIVPAHRNDSKPDNVANGVGLTLKDYVEACYEVCELLSVPVIDMWKELGFSPFNNTMKNTYMKDGLHPTIEGMRKYYGKKICKAIK